MGLAVAPMTLRPCIYNSQALTSPNMVLAQKMQEAESGLRSYTPREEALCPHNQSSIDSQPTSTEDVMDLTF